MRTHRRISAFVLAAGLSLGACSGDGGGEAELDSADGISPVTGEERTPSSGDGGQSLGSPTAQEQATSVDDTTPHRPGAPAPP